MSYVIRLVHPFGLSARADEATTVALAKAAALGELVKGDYLKWSNPDARDGYGDDGWTPNLSHARKFETFEDAAACWQAQSTIRPYRDDGKPNRPMTAYSVSIEQAPER